MQIFRRHNSVIFALLIVSVFFQTVTLTAQRPSSATDREKYAAAVAMFHEADALAHQDDKDKKRAAIEKFMSAAATFHAIGSASEEANTLNAAANVHDELNEPHRALPLYIRVADILTATREKDSLATTLNNIGAIFSAVGAPLKALEYFNRVLPLRRELRDKYGEALTLSYIGGAYDEMGQSRKAIDYYEKAIAIRRKVGDKRGEAASLGNLGVSYSTLGETKKALDYLNRSLVLSRSIGNKEGEASALHNIGNTYDTLGDTTHALDFYERSLALARDSGDKKRQAATLNNIGTIYFELGDKEKAGPMLKEALQLRMMIGDMSGIVATCINLSFYLEPKDAIAMLSDTLVLTRGLGYRSAEAETLHNMAWAYATAGDNLKAIEYYNQALPIRRFVGDKSGEARTLANMMHSWEKLGNNTFAAFYGKQAINRYQLLRSSIRTMELGVRKTYLSTIEDSYRDLAEILIAQGRIAEAEEVLGMLKEEEVFAFQRREDKVARELLQTSTLTGGERLAVAEYEKIAERITGIALEYGDLDRERLEYPEGKFPKQARLDELERQRADAILAFQKYLERLKVEFAKSSKQNEVAQVDSSLQDTLREMKTERTAVVSTIVGDKRLSIIVTTPDVQRAHAVDISEVELNKLVGDFRRALTSPAGGKPIDPRPAGQKLYDILVKPIEGDLAGIKADTIVWSLDGTLRYLPMAAVWDKQQGYLAERFANSVITLASRDRLLLPAAKKDWTALGAGVSAGSDGFSPLAAVPDELDCIVTDPVNKTVSLKPICSTGVIRGQKLLDDKFNEQAFRAAVGRYSVLHLASHFKLVPGNDNDSFLLLGGGEDRRFTVSKLNGLSLTGVELLALSACNTATPGGAKENGVEIEGFGAVAQKRGARSVMATLWPVADPSTRDFVVEFYRRFGTGTETKAESIRAAQLKLMRGSYPASNGRKPPRADNFVADSTAVGPPFETDKNAPYAHPYYWAPFILFGNWR